MEAVSEVEKKKPPEGGEAKSKRQMKTAYQLEILEKTYAVEAYPSDALRAELSQKLGLSDRQLQMWFCHRRMKDRNPLPLKRQRKDSPAPGGDPSNGEEMAVGEVASEHGPGFSPFGHGADPRGVVSRPGVALPRIGADMPAMKRYYELSPPQLTAELRAIGFVEAQLGEPLREDGPILGMEFDPLPPGAFGAPIGVPTSMHHKQSWQAFEAKPYERPDANPVKGSVRTLHEYQFLPVQPTARTDQYERVTLSHHYGSSIDDPNAKTSAISAGRSFMHGDEQVASGYGFPTQIPNLNLLSHQGKQGHLLPSALREYNTVSEKDSFTNTAADANFVAHSITALENPFVSSDRRVSHDEDVSRMERKRKNEEARIAREVEAHEKRIRKELEKRDMLRRKEQIKKEMERHDRERRKEEERLLREKQREEERYLREQRRELERREKFFQKESIKAEKMRQKEKLRRKKEAAKLKAANERAIARKIAKESMELIEDERLELMELAARIKGLPSIISLDFETLQNLDLFRDKMSVFPPKTVQLRRPFAIEPWNGSEENIGNLLMVWRFLTTFSDVLGLWPFNLDEFVQAFHDYDPLLLGEIHVALLRSIIKDIEDVARTPSTGLGSNKNSAANPGGGHPHIVEGAYTWGFDMRSWQRHLNALTWPEILRQFALSAGFGPQLKGRNVEQAYLRDDNEGNDGEDIISTLRNGAAAENAVVILQERGFSNPRRSRHRLTPGTVKFAAFHVLSLEGREGLTILEVAEKIQKSGLRDLTTSKTPEASIAAALSRDTKLFERTAPSTYCVRPAYRKDPADAEAILSSARERIRIFKSGVVEGEDVDDAERDGDSASDVADDAEVDDLGTELNPKEEAHNSLETDNSNVKTLLGNGKGSGEVMETPQGGFGNVSEGLSSMHSEDLNEVKRTGESAGDSIVASGICNGAPSLDKVDSDIDESNPGEPWVQGLVDEDYSDLSVEERLNALVALIGVAIEGNLIRVILEERLEAANVLKKLMWAEVQLDKCRMKEEYVMKTHYSLYVGNKSEPNLAIPSGEGRQSPLVTVDKSNETSVNPIFQQERSSDPQSDQNFVNIPSEGNLQMQDTTVGPDNFPYQQPGYAVEKSRSQLKSYVGYRAEEMYIYRSLPLGQDRRRNRYWRFTTSASWNDPGCGRIFVELQEGHWRLIDSEEGLDDLLASLDVRGVRESQLHSMLQKIEMSFKEAVRRNALHAQRQSRDTVKKESIEMTSGPDCNLVIDSPCSTVRGSDSDLSETSTTFTIQLGRNETEKNDTFKRYQDFEKWMLKERFNSASLCAIKYGKRRCKELLGLCDYCYEVCYFKDSHCPSCNKTYGDSKSELNFSEHAVRCEEKLKIGINSVMNVSVSSPLRIRLLKVQLALVEVSVPPEALQSVWTDSYRKSWVLKLHSSSSAEKLLQSLTLLESAVKRDYLSSNFETTSELLGFSNQSGGAASDPSATELVPVLPWVLITTAAVALRLIEFDNSIAYMLNQKAESHKDKGDSNFMKLPSKYTVVKNTQDNGTAEAPLQAAYPEEANWFEVTIGFSGFGRGRCRGRGRGRTRGGRSQRRAVGSRSEPGRRITITNSKGLGKVLGWKGRPGGRRGRKRGSRSTKIRQKSAKRVQIVDERENHKEIIVQKSTRGLASNDWNGNEIARLQLDGAEDASSSGRSEYNDEKGQATGDECDEILVENYPGGFNRRSDELMEDSYYNVDDDEDDDDDSGGGGGEGDDGAEDEQGDLDVEEYVNEDSNEGLGDEDDQDGDPNSF